MSNVDPKVIDALQEQMNNERYNSQMYSFISQVMANQSYDGFAKYFMKQSQQELEHAQKFADFLISKRVQPKYLTLNAIVDFSNEKLSGIAKRVYELELTTTSNIQNLYQDADNAGEYQVCSFLVDLLVEQVEEETWSFDLYDLLNKTDENGWVVLDKVYGDK